jgi:serine/threonine-protein kinase
VVRVLDASAPDATLPYLAMERLRGHTLAETLRTEAKLGGAAVVAVIRDVARALDAAAAAGIVHRDLKPQNVFHAGDGTWKLLDFGVASFADDSGTLTHGDVVGTPHYMAPEQARGNRVDSRADLFALAAIAYRCLTGRHPFNAADTPSLLYAVVHRQPPRPGELAELPADVDLWFALALAKDPGARFASGAALADALAAALAGELPAADRRRAASLTAKQPWEGA